MDALATAHIDTFVDVRQRRGMRGSKYAFLNSQRLQQQLSAAGIRYLHEVGLAPTSTVRDVQKAADADQRIAKRDRAMLSKDFIEAYCSHVLTDFDFDAFRERLADSEKVVFFCVETSPMACHRSLAVERIALGLDSTLPVEHILP